MSANEEKEQEQTVPVPEAPQEEAPAEEAQQPEPTREELLEQQLKETDDRYKRVLAEYQNFRNRSQKERESLYLDAVASTAASFLPVIDTLDRAAAQETDENCKKSLELITRQYLECLDRIGVKAFGERGEPFDPNLHNAVMTAEDEELEPNTIAEVLLKGYRLGERVVRHAMVKVAQS